MFTNISVTKCRLAEEALSLLRKKEGTYDIVIIDVYLPGMDGFKLLEFINQEMKEMNLPVVSKYVYIHIFIFNLYSRTKHFL